MFLGTCSGCFEIPTPLYYWNPYVTHAYTKTSPLQLANILQLQQTAEKSDKRLVHAFSGNRLSEDDSDKRLPHGASSTRLVEDDKESLKNKIHEPKTQQFPSRYQDVCSNAVLDFSRRTSDKCTLPSALEPLKALCSEGPRGIGNSSPGSSRSLGSRSPPTPPKKEQLKFGINNILSKDFGKAKSDKDSLSTPESLLPYDQRRSCECTYDTRCHIYRDHMRYTPHALSAVHALQPPKYPTSPNGSDVLPDVSLASHSKRKRSWSRAVFSNLQRKGLEKRFEVQKYVTKPDRRQLAAMLGLTDAQVKVWFQNRRMKWRHAQQTNAEEDLSSQIADDKPAKLDSDQPSTKENFNTEDISSESDEEISVQDSNSSMESL